jgi:O-antigen/teichoic acid export membrane protein
MSGVRVTYSGFIAFGIRLISIITGLFFILIVTRQLSPEEFGTWGVINGIMVYAIIIHPVVTYWSTRETARDENSEKTAISMISFLSIIGIVVYLIIAYITGINSDADTNILLFAAILIPLTFINEGLNAIVSGYRPQVRSYGFLIFEITKVPVALILVYFLKLGIEGAILASFVAYIANITLLLIFARKKLHGKWQKKYVKKWFKLFWVPIYRKIPGLISMSDVVIFSIVTGSVIGVAYYTAARTIGFLVFHSRSIGMGVYPKLLQGGHEKILRDNLMIFFYVSFPIITLSITFAKPALFALNPIYQVAVPVVILLALRQFITSLNMLLFSGLQGIEKVDVDDGSTINDYLKSKLVLFPTFQMIRHGVYIGSLVIILIIIGTNSDNQIELVTYWALIGLIVEIPLFLYIIRLVKKSFTLEMNYLRILKYAISSLTVFGIIYFIMEEFLIYSENIVEFLPNLMIFALLGGFGYLGITYFIDNNTRVLVKSVLKEIKGKKGIDKKK